MVTSLDSIIEKRINLLTYHKISLFSNLEKKINKYIYLDTLKLLRDNCRLREYVPDHRK